MPYINSANRLDLAEITDEILCTEIRSAGELNYLITKLCIEYMSDNGKSYQHINDVVGALEGAKIEFYRRYAAPYEDTKIIENGDVYSV